MSYQSFAMVMAAMSLVSAAYTARKRGWPCVVFLVMAVLFSFDAMGAAP